MLLRTIAVIGCNGLLGEPTIEALTTTFSHKVSYPIIAITRSIKDKKSNEKVKYVKADINQSNLDKLYDIFTGIDVIIEVTAVDMEVFATLEIVAARTKPKLYLPSEFGMDLQQVNKYFQGFPQNKTYHTNNLRKIEGIKVIDVITSLFAVQGAHLYEWVSCVGVDPKKQTVTYYGDPDFKFAISMAKDIGYTCAALATASDYSMYPDTVRIYSDVVSQREVVQRYQKTHNVTLKEESIVSKEDALAEAKERIAKGFDFKDIVHYAHVFLAQGEGKGVAYIKNNDRESVNPKESLWKWESY